MKRIILAAVVAAIFLFGGTLYSRYLIVDVFVCGEGIVMAEIIAKAAVNRKEIYSVSYCDCEGIDKSQKIEVKGMSCDPPADNVYACSCVGREKY
jgi:hypothetical protein